MRQPLKAFIIYSRKDEAYKNDLMLYVEGYLIATGYLEILNDGNNIPAGEDWEKKIEYHLESSDLFLVLISNNLLTSDFIQRNEIVTALEKKSRIVPILIRSCLWNNHPILAGVQVLPKNLKPIYSSLGQGDPWIKVMSHLQGLVIRIWAEQSDSSSTSNTFNANQLPKFDWEPDMVFVKGGTFQMGDEKGDLWDVSRPVHTVTLSDFEIGKYPVTQKEWQAVMGNNPSRFKGELLPVENVNIDDCQAYLKKMNEITSRKYRFLSEAEWEFAARGGNDSRGTLYAGNDNVDEVAWYRGNSEGATHSVGQKQPNELGIFDLSGNVYEWCNNWYEAYPPTVKNNPIGPIKGLHRAMRGGSWLHSVTPCRVSDRDFNRPDERSDFIGFRVAFSHH